MAYQAAVIIYPTITRLSSNRIMLSISIWAFLSLRSRAASPASSPSAVVEQAQLGSNSSHRCSQLRTYPLATATGQCKCRESTRLRRKFSSWICTRRAISRIRSTWWITWVLAIDHLLLSSQHSNSTRLTQFKVNRGATDSSIGPNLKLYISSNSSRMDSVCTIVME